MAMPSVHGMGRRQESRDSDSISAYDIFEQTSDAIFAQLRAGDKAQAQAEDAMGLLSKADIIISYLSFQFITNPNSDFSHTWLPQLENLWHMYYVAAKYCSPAAVAPLVLQVVETSQRGMLWRTRIDNNGNIELEPARLTVQSGNDTIELFLWHQLPLMVRNMTNYWVRDCAHMSRMQRKRLSFFLTSLSAASTDPWAYELCYIGLIVLCDTLEEQRMLFPVVVVPGGEDSEDAGRSIDMLAISDLLRCVNSWLCTAGSRIVQLCEMGDANTYKGLPKGMSDAVTQLGPLAVEDGVQAVPCGFSSQRWFFWLRRLEALGDVAPSRHASPESESSRSMGSFRQRAEEFGQIAMRVAKNMVYTAAQSDSVIVRELMRMGKLPLL
ncbi:hypothetical protein F4775DRAFT_440493 [Biscogniauxia sp. FL1348]|nr:hypothetical protein F4775DRAFT_440493 [Biscogniauxia sp. FL1348]